MTLVAGHLWVVLTSKHWREAAEAAAAAVARSAGQFVLRPWGSVWQAVERIYMFNTRAAMSTYPMYDVYIQPATDAFYLNGYYRG